MYIINAVEIRKIRGEIKQVSTPEEVEYHYNIIDATTNMSYFNTLFGKHYRFYIVEKKNNTPYNG